MKKAKIVFMGTPEISVAILDRIIKDGHDVVGVVTAPDRQAGRGRKIMQSAVKKYAEQHRLNTLQPEKLRDPEFNATLDSLDADIYVVLAFRMLPEMVWSKPKLGTFNLHASLLPQYRGAAPINWAIINGESKTGLTTFMIDKEIDTGNILLQHEMNIAADETAGSLHDRMMVDGAELVSKSLQGILKGELTAKAQNPPGDIKHAPKIFSEDCVIDWSKSTKEVYNLIRGLSPYPAAKMKINELNTKVYKTEMLEGELTPGQIKTDNKTFIHVGCSDGVISLLDLQIEGKKRMGVEDLLRGFTVEIDG